MIPLTDNDLGIEKQTQLAEMLGDIRARLIMIEKCVNGNGQPGILQRLMSLELWRAMLVGGWLLLTALIYVWKK